MNGPEISEVMDWLGSVNIEELPIPDAMILMSAMNTMCETVKPVMVKQKMNSGSTFITRL